MTWIRQLAKIVVWIENRSGVKRKMFYFIKGYSVSINSVAHLSSTQSCIHVASAYTQMYREKQATVPIRCLPTDL